LRDGFWVIPATLKIYEKMGKDTTLNLRFFCPETTITGGLIGNAPPRIVVAEVVKGKRKKAVLRSQKGILTFINVPFLH
jgi:hypothetical protein